jgi:transposase
MARSDLVDDELWELVKPLLPDRAPQRTGHPRVSDRAAFTAIMFVLVTRVPWRLVPDRIVADRIYDHDSYRRKLRRRGVKPSIARRGTKHGSGLGLWRWVVERTSAWLHNCRRQRIRWERDPVVHMAFLTLG